MLVLGHLGFTLIAARLAAPFLRLRQGFPVHVLLVGALLPDVIDKPLGHAILPWENGRLWGHTLLLVLALAGLAWVRRSRIVAALAMGTGMHQLLDQMPWTDPASWLWPLGGAFPRGLSPGVPDWIDALLTDPYIWTTEATGLAALVALLVAPYMGWTRAWWDQPTATEAGPGLGAEAASEPEAEP